MSTATISQIASIAGLSIQATTTRTEAGQIGHDPSLAAGKAGNLTTRTNDTDGELTMATGHGITNGQMIDIFWTDANGVGQCAYGATVGTVATNAVPFTGAAGTVLPADEYAIVACVVTTLDTDFDGDLLEMIAAGATYLAHMTFRDVGDAVLAAVTLLAGELWSWSKNQGVANPLTGNAVAYVEVSNGYSAAANTLKLGALYDSDG